MERGKQTLVFPCKHLKNILQSGPRPALSGSIGRKNYLGTDIGLNIPDGLNTEVLCGSRIDPEAKLILELNYACSYNSTLTTLAQLFIMSMNVTLRSNTFNPKQDELFANWYGLGRADSAPPSVTLFKLSN